MPLIGTGYFYLCHCKLKNEVIMWIAVIIFVCLSVEVISYLRGDETETDNSMNEVACDYSSDL